MSAGAYLREESKQRVMMVERSEPDNCGVCRGLCGDAGVREVHRMAQESLDDTGRFGMQWSIGVSRWHGMFWDAVESWVH